VFSKPTRLEKEAVAAEAVGSEMEIVLSEPINDPSFVENYIDKLSARTQFRGNKTAHNAQTFSPAHVELLKEYQVPANLGRSFLTMASLWEGNCSSPVLLPPVASS